MCVCVFYRCFLRVCGVCACARVCEVIVIVNSCVYEYYYIMIGVTYFILFTACTVHNTHVKHF